MKIMRYEHFDICNFEFEKNVRKEKKYYFLKINNYLKYFENTLNNIADGM